MTNCFLKAVIKGLRLFLATESPLKMMKNASCFTSNVLSVLKILNVIMRIKSTFSELKECLLDR